MSYIINLMGLSFRRLFFGHLFVLLYIVILFYPPNVSAQGVKQWEPFTLEFTTSRSHNWESFPLKITFTRGSASLTLDGFFDGQNSGGEYLWKVRFAPPQTGTWNWQTSSSDISLSDHTGSFSVTQASSSEISSNPNYRGHIRVSSNNRHFEYADSTPFFLLGDTSWEMNTQRSGVGTSDPDFYNNRNFYTWLNDRVAKGFTAVFTKAFSRRGDKNEGGNAFPRATSGNFSELNPDFFQYFDIRMQVLWERGLIVGLLPTWVGKSDITPSVAKNIGRYLLARYGAYNIIYSLSGEYQYGYDSSGPSWTRSNWNSYGNFIQTYNPYDHPVSVHPSGRTNWGGSAGEQSSAGEFHTQSWLDHNWTQTRHMTTWLWRVYQRTEENYNKTPAKPVIHSEGYYENINQDGATADMILWQAWVAYLNGASHVYGATGIWQFYDPSAPTGSTGLRSNWNNIPWQEALNFTGSKYLSFFSDFFTNINWWQLTPHRDWLKLNGSSPASPSSSNLKPPHLAASQGNLYVAFIPAGNRGSIISITNLGNATYIARWFNPKTGNFTDISNGPSGVTSWDLPDRPSPRDGDWVLILTSNQATTPTPPPITIPGDIDVDGDVDIFDYNILVTDFGQSSSPADFNGNGVVDIFDYNILVGNFGRTS